MALTDLFRPKYKHSKPSVRADAVRGMSSDEADLLVRIAESDRDPEVRRLAISKLDDAEVLVDLVAREESAAVREEAQTRAAEIWSRAVLGDDREVAREALGRLAMLGDQSHLAELVARIEDTELRAAAVERMTSERALADIVRTGTDAATRMAALDKIGDEEVLRSIATDESRKAIGIAAVDRLSSVAALEHVAGKAKNKHVRARALKRKSELTVVERPRVSAEDKRAHAERVQLARKVKPHVRSNEWIESHAAVSAARERWQELGDGDDAALAERFHDACDRFFARYEAVGRPALEAARERAAREAAEVAQAAERAAAAEAERFRDDAARAEVAEPDEAPRTSASGERGEKEDQDRDAGSAAERDAARRAAREQRDKVNLARLSALCVELEELGAVKRFKGIERKLGQAAKTFASLRLPAGEERDQLVERYEAARRAVLIRVQELREADEWKRWAALPKLQALIERATALEASEETGHLGGELKALQAAWKEVGPGPHARNQELWETFKAACDRVYDRVKAHRQVAAAEQAENLQKKIALCEEVERIADSTDWDETAARIKQLQAEWKAVGPVPRKKSRQVWQRFRSACDRFFDRRKPVLDERLEELRANLGEKEAICAELEALAESEADWDDVLEALKGLRSRWRNVGHVPRQDYAALSERYRLACDRVFARRDEAEKARRDEAGREVEALISRLDQAMQKASAVDAGWDDEAVVDPADEAEVVAAACELRAAALELEDYHTEQRERARALIRAAVEANPEAFDGSELDPQRSRQRRLRLIERLEELLPGEAEQVSIESLSAEEVAAKLREALAANALGIVSEATRPVADIVEEIRTSWNLLGPVPGREGLELSERFDSARLRVLDAYVDDE